MDRHNLHLARPAFRRRLLGSVVLNMLVVASTAVSAQENVVTSAAMSGPRIWAVSQPPAPVLPTDPPAGLIFGLPHDLSSAAPTFDASSGTSSNAVGIGDAPLSLEYLRFSRAGDGYATFRSGSEDAPGSGGVLFLEGLEARSGGRYGAPGDGLLTGARTGLVGPRDLAVADAPGVLVVADFAAADLKVFDLGARGDVAPRFVTGNLGVTAEGDPRAPWGLAFNDADDRLYVAATDGTVLVYDDYLQGRGEAGPDRVLTPTVGGTKAAANLHGISYLPGRDILIVSDVGAATAAGEAGFDTDGKVFVLENASAADGDTEVRAQLAGPASLLGNPVGLAVDGGTLYIAEKAGNVVLRFDGVLELTGTLDPAPSGAVTVTAPEAVTLTR